MSVMVILLGASLTVGLIFLAAFIWSVKTGQFDDDFSPAHKILFENTTAASGAHEINKIEVDKIKTSQKK